MILEGLDAYIYLEFRLQLHPLAVNLGAPREVNKMNEEEHRNRFTLCP